MRPLLFSLAITLLVAGAAVAADGCTPPAPCDKVQCHQDHGCCARCGGKMVCKVVCDVREIKKPVWVVKCEPVCLPLPRLGHGPCTCGNPAPAGCEACCADGTCGAGKKCGNPCAVELAKCQVPPKCGPVRIKKTLEKKEVVCKVPTYKCVPACGQCGCAGAACDACGPAAQQETTPKG